MRERRVEEASLNSWPAHRQLLLDGWLVRFSEGYTKRANSVTPIYQSTLEMSKKIALCERLYQEQGLPTIFRLPSFPEGVQQLDTLLLQSGYRLLDPTSVLYTELSHSEALPISSLRFTTLDEWLEYYCRFRQVDPGLQQRTHRAILQRIVLQTFFALLYEDDVPVACGLGVLEGETFGLFDIVVDADYRRKGIGTRLITSMLTLARHNGATCAYLQVLNDNSAALDLYAKLGFSELYHYWYRVQP